MAQANGQHDTRRIASHHLKKSVVNSQSVTRGILWCDTTTFIMRLQVATDELHERHLVPDTLRGWYTKHER